MAIEVLLLTGKRPTDLKGGALQAAQVAVRFAAFVDAARTSLDIAIYHFHLKGPAGATVMAALKAARGRGVAIRIATFREPARRSTAPAVRRGDGHTAQCLDPMPAEALGAQAPSLQGLEVAPLPHGIQTEPIGGEGHLMHSKYMIRDGEAIWMGSANFTLEAWSVQDNNIVILEDAAHLARYYQTDFDELWASGRLAGTGRQDHGSLQVGPTPVEVDFSPGDGADLEATLARLLAGTRHDIHIASMVITSGPILEALAAALERGVRLTGVYDGSQMATVQVGWDRGRAAGTVNGKPSAWAKVKARLVAKPSDACRPGASYNLMHNKTLVLDGATVVTGSFNFSDNAAHNAENVLVLHDAKLARQYSEYIENLPKAWS
jgi:phosphatidylserine/phosphatidylglycerophosphate/cardiolipin synthase-like enzyme